MRVRETNNGLTVQAVAGTYVVLLAMHMDKSECSGLMGFAIHRIDHSEDEAYWLEGKKTFEETDPKLASGWKYPTNKHPIQGFTWSDFTAKPGHRYTYKIVALRGEPTALEAYKEVELVVTTESEAGGDHTVYFNRGASASQEFALRFDSKANLAATESDDPRWAWLSRGAFESILAFISRAKDSNYALRVAAYEFRLEPFAKALKAARDRGVDVQILFDACDNPPDAHGEVFPRDQNLAMAATARIKSLCAERVTRDDVKKPPIAHNKFVVLLKANKAKAVLTGSTNFSRGGVFGQANVVHVVDQADIANRYLKYWELLRKNPNHQELRQALGELNAIPSGLPDPGTDCIFSPQPTTDALEWYAKLARQTPGALMMTFPFGMGDHFKDAYRSGQAQLRYALMDKLLGSGVRKDKKEAALAEMKEIRQMKENRIAVGSSVAVPSFDRWVKEHLTGLNKHVQYIHTKFMLLNPLSDDPVVISGSANFSAASTTDNDENMLVIRGDTRVADIYLGEYMRLWNHYAFREWVAAGSPGAPAQFKYLDVKDKWWRIYFGDTAQSRQRAYFAGIA
jgi:phosphatidylserine/phosphatidylglycerophosphate/cardiolipin synthase-like enzyme